MQGMGQATRRMTLASAAALGATAVLGLIPWALVAAEAAGKDLLGQSTVSAATSPSAADTTPQVLIEARFLDAPAGMSRKTMDAVASGSRDVTLLSPAQTTGFLNQLQTAKDVSLLSAPKLLTLMGHTATVQVGQSLPNATGDSDADFEGLSLQVMPETKGRDLTVKIDARRRTRVPIPGGPTFQESRIDTRLTMTPDQTALVAGAAAQGREFVMLISVKVLPQGQNGIPHE